MQTKRRYTREKVLQALYAYELTKDPIKKIKQDLLSDIKEPDNAEFAEKLVTKTLENRKKYDELITSTVKNWELDRIALIDHIIIRMCLCEFNHFEEIPPKVSINEAIELAKSYSTRNSGKFVNGILDSLLLRLKEEGKVSKKGKGLKES
jgi:N utilization substance protein B